MAGVVADIVKGQLLALPPVRKLYERRRAVTGYADENQADYVRGVYLELREHLEPHRPIAGQLLEIGPGGNNAVSALFAANGIDRAVCIDVVPWATGNEALYDELGVHDALSRVEYLHPVGIEHVPQFADGSFDFIVSHATFEHFADPAAACAEIARLLKPGGVTTHEFDLRNHRDMNDPLDHLRYPGWLWQLMTAGRPFRTHRWRLSDVLDGLTRAGLQVVGVEHGETRPVTEAERARLHPQFRSKSLDDLAVLGAFVTAVKPA